MANLDEIFMILKVKGMEGEQDNVIFWRPEEFYKYDRNII